MKIWTACFALTLLACASMAHAEDRALLIGIGQYKSNGISNLGGPANDVKMLKDLATELLGYEGSQVKTLVDSQATGQGIRQAVKSWLIDGTQPGDRVLLTYSGHGAQQKDTNGDEKDGLDETLVPYDAERARQGVLGMITDDEVEGWLKALSGRLVTVVVDSCHSGTVSRAVGRKASEGLVRTIFPVSTEPLSRGVIVANREEETLVTPVAGQITVWTAVSSFQLAMDDVDAKPRSGVFTNRLVRALRTQAADRDRSGQTSHGELLDWLRQESTAFYDKHRDLCETPLTPTLETAESWLAQPVEVSLIGQGSQPITVAESSDDLLSPPNAQEMDEPELLIEDENRRTGRTRFRDGEQVWFKVRSPKDGYLTLLNIQADGSLYQLFPEVGSSTENKIAKGREIVWPHTRSSYEVIVGEPYGENVVIALVTVDPVDLSPWLNQAHEGLRVTDPRTYLEGIGKKLRSTWTADGSDNRSADWMFSKIVYQATP